MTLRWNPALAVGHRDIDAQHQELFVRLDALVGAMDAGDRAEIARRFDLLGDFAVEHFRVEEQLMRDTGFPGATVHRAAHERFLRDYRALRKLFDDHGPAAAVAVKTRTWIVDWLQRHIGATDQALARHLLKRTG